MAEEKDYLWLDIELNNEQIPIVIDLAVALREVEVEKFLELYDSIPESVETKRVSCTSFFVRLPCKQEDAIDTNEILLL
jgi:hypothetical protein